ncbi:hypothetical protein GMA19_04855 [Paenibacillus polymyxa E681]|uniref:class I SAM-dependent methyltransferase n=1 Tax=Paenibacillus polymyxa TaxID=1406 RepID=UPI0001E32227|nr:class I SAM-dependent methyltransferase [Paenibacillus polymyxa]ADM72609.1 type 11 methyltransferase [Paenibacillus polymyxa E681]QNV59638.1 hypothetical protein GE561_04866 [Paenibacillus polymyxa E681]QNV64464.1 hypothetical protein GMA19_04855 [Paenibacillus polymyxa E681]
MDNKKQEWQNSYKNGENHVFFPHEEVIRFFAKYITKRVGLQDYKTIHTHQAQPRFLDVGCGIGRHIIFSKQMGLDSYGIDLSDEAIMKARAWASSAGIDHIECKIVAGSITKMPWNDGFFQFAGSNGVFDSMNFEIAKEGIRETARVLEKEGLFYCDLISGDDSNHSREFTGEEISGTGHEQGTVQMYYNYSKILDLIGSNFAIEEITMIRNENILTGFFHSRYHLILRKRMNSGG